MTLKAYIELLQAFNLSVNIALLLPLPLLLLLNKDHSPCLNLGILLCLLVPFFLCALFIIPLHTEMRVFLLPGEVAWKLKFDASIGGKNQFSVCYTIKSLMPESLNEHIKSARFHTDE